MGETTIPVDTTSHQSHIPSCFWIPWRRRVVPDDQSIDDRLLRLIVLDVLEHAPESLDDTERDLAEQLRGDLDEL